MTQTLGTMADLEHLARVLEGQGIALVAASWLLAYATHQPELYWSGALTLLLIIVWPLLALPAGVFNKGYFHMWVPGAALHAAT